MCLLRTQRAVGNRCRNRCIGNIHFRFFCRLDSHTLEPNIKRCCGGGGEEQPRPLWKLETHIKINSQIADRELHVMSSPVCVGEQEIRKEQNIGAGDHEEEEEEVRFRCLFRWFMLCHLFLFFFRCSWRQGSPNCHFVFCICCPIVLG